MKAMILAAGLGTRLRPLTDRLPKPLLPVGDRPLIHYGLLLLRKYGITEVIINLHHCAQKLRDSLGDGTALGIRIHYSEEPEILGTGGGLRKVMKFLSNGTFILINGDILVDVNLDKVVEHHQKKRAAATMVLREDPAADQWGAIETDGQGQIRRILQKGGSEGDHLSKYMFTGVHVLEPLIFQYIPAGRFYSIMDAYVEMLQKGEKMYGYPMRGYWMDLGTPERYHQAHRDIQSGVIKLGYLR